MAVDVRSLARAAAEAALGDEAPKKKGLSPWQALAIGAGLVTAGRIATGPGGRFVRELVEGHSSNGPAEDEEPEAEADDEPQAEAVNEPQAEADNEPDAEQDEWAAGEAEGGRPGRPRHPLFEHALAPKAAQRRDSESPKRREPKGRRTAPPRRPRRPRTPAQRA